MKGKPQPSWRRHPCETTLSAINRTTSFAKAWSRLVEIISHCLLVKPKIWLEEISKTRLSIRSVSDGELDFVLGVISMKDLLKLKFAVMLTMKDEGGGRRRTLIL
jgi:hypothetical protein